MVVDRSERKSAGKSMDKERVEHEKEDEDEKDEDEEEEDNLTDSRSASVAESSGCMLRSRRVTVVAEEPKAVKHDAIDDKLLATEEGFVIL
jgi:hypothetical protein